MVNPMELSLLRPLFMMWSVRYLQAISLPVVLLSFYIFTWAHGASAQNYHKEYYEYPEYTLPQKTQASTLLTPRATMENFYFSAKDGNYEQAARSLHLGLSGENINPAEIARKLWPLLDKHITFQWNDLPDLPDGIKNNAGAAKNTQPNAIKNIEISEIELGDRYIPIYLQRFMDQRTGELVWVFSPRFVKFIPDLYEAHKPAEWEKKIPENLRQQYFNIPLWQWFLLPLLLFASWGVGVLFEKITVYLTCRIQHPLVKKLVPKLRVPLITFFGVIALKILSSVLLSLSGPILQISNVLFTIIIISAFMWALTGIFGYYLDFLQDRLSKDLETERDGEKKEKLTQISVARRVAIFVALLVGGGIILMQFDMFENLGAGFITSAGVLTVILGIAGQATLGNIIAGLQIAIAKPVRIGDTLSYDGKWCYAEEITYTYITLKIWDDRRIIVPLKKFISEPFENWSKNDSHLLQPIYLYADYTLDIQKIREKFSEELNKQEAYDTKHDPTVQAYACSERTLCIRLLCSAQTSSQAWSLHCEMREIMNSYLASLEGGKYLPRERQANVMDPASPGYHADKNNI